MEKRHCFGMLYKYELLKIFKNKVAIITFLCLFAYAFIQGEFEVSGNISPQDLEKYEEINGRAIDEELFAELKELSDDAGNIKDETRKGYKKLYYWISEVMNYNASLRNLDIEKVYAEREHSIQDRYESMCLTPQEINFWQGKEKNLKKPFIYYDDTRSSGLLEGTTNYMIMMALIIASSLSSIFALETHRKTDPMIRTTINGGKEVYFAKVLAGMSYILSCVAILLITLYTYIACRCGIKGMDCMVQVYLPLTSLDMTLNDLFLILVVLLVMGTILIASFALFFSNITRNSVTTMTIVVGSFMGLLIAAFNVPLKFRFLSQFLCMFPGSIVTARLVYDFRLIKIGKYFMSYQIAPIMYILFSVVFIACGYVFYKRYEIKSN